MPRELRADAKLASHLVIFMKSAWRLKIAVVSLTLLGHVAPQQIWAQSPPASQNSRQRQSPAPLAAPAVVDVALGDKNELSGQVVDAQGVGFSGADVSIWQGDRQLGSTKADAQGRFEIGSLRGGVYRVLAAGGCSVCRVWTRDAAPPAARRAALIVAGQDIVRGRMGPTRWQQATPWVMAGVLGAAMIVPISLTNDNPSGS